MKTSEAQFEAKVELIPTSFAVGISGSDSPLLAANIKIKFNYNTSLLYGEEVYFKIPIIDWLNNIH